MKKIFLLLVSICASAQISFAQLIWHPDMGSPYSGVVALQWNARHYTFEANNYGDYGDPGEIWNSLEQQLASEGVAWIRINSVENPASGVFEICFEMDENDTELSRSIYLGDGMNYFKIKQVSPHDHPLPKLPQNRCFEICPGGSISIPILETTNGEYEIIRINPDNTEDIAFSFYGNSETYTFTGRPAAGKYYFLGIPDSEFTVKYFDAFDYIFESDQNRIIADADGGVYKVYITHYNDGSIRKQITSISDLAFFDLPFASFNAGESTYWNPNMEISYGFDNKYSAGYIKILCPPNLSASDIINNSHITLKGNTAIMVKQSGGGIVKNVPVEYSLDIANDQLHARINNTQPRVAYTLYRDGIRQMTEPGTGYTVNLSASRISGHYYVIAEYSSGLYSGRETLNATTLAGDGNALLNYKHNWIFSQLHNDDDKSICDITYYNGLGYAQQEIQLRATEFGDNDLIRPIAYDHLWRESRQYLPYARTIGLGEFDPDALANQTEFYRTKFSISDADPYAYVENIYDAASDRILSSRKPGTEYREAERAIIYNYFGNAENSVRQLDIEPASGSMIVNGHYAANTLSCVKTTDEDGASAIVYTDKEGRTIAEERQLRQPDNTVESLITHYVYDDCGRLSWIITPKGYDLLQDGAQYNYADELAHLYCYIYRYDDRGRIIVKALPNRHPEYSVYDNGDRIVMSQDGNMRLENQWMIYHYDDFGRIVEQSIVTDAPNNDSSLRHKEFISDFANSVQPEIYSGESTIVHQYFYDDYAQLPDSRFDFTEDELTKDGDTALMDTRVKGLLVYERLAEIAGDGIDGYCERAFYYDYKGREIQRVESRESGYAARTSNKYDFIGNILSRREEYTHGGITDISKAEFKYDPRNRLLSETILFNEEAQSNTRYKYDDLGQLSMKGYGERSSILSETMTYNMQGWLTEKSSPLFSMKLRYYNPQNASTTPSYSGNISEWQWSHDNTEYDGNTDYTYAFSYDDLSRLNSTAIYGESSQETSDNYPYIGLETDIEYDKNSNIDRFYRKLAGSVQPFHFEYAGNCRIGEEYSGKSYIYDYNGNIVKDEMSDLDISFNFINLPCEIIRTTTERDRFGKIKKTMQNFTYRYLSDGTKVAVTDKNGNGFMYLGSARFSCGANGTEFESLPFSGGRIVNSSNGCRPQYHLTDHLGSTRVVAAYDKEWTDIERRNYTPFGKEWETPFFPTSENNFTFSGKEKQTLGNIGFLDFGARLYDPEGGIFLQQDPLAEKYSHIGQYCYCAGNPIKFIDPDGRMLDWYETADGNLNSQIKYTDLTSQKALDAAGIKGKYLGKDVIVATHNRDSNLNEPINTARFDLYLSSNPDGISATIFGNTVPADVNRFGTLAEGLYSAKFQSRDSYKKKGIDDLAIIINDGNDVPTVNGNPNKANSDMLDEIFLHMGNNYRESLFDSKGNAYSKGCQTTGHYKDSHDDHKKFMEVVGRNFNGFYYLRGK